MTTDAATQKIWIAETIQTTKEQGISRTDLGREILLSLAGEIGAWKIVTLCGLFLLATAGGAVIGAVKLWNRR